MLIIVIMVIIAGIELGVTNWYLGTPGSQGSLDTDSGPQQTKIIRKRLTCDQGENSIWIKHFKSAAKVQRPVLRSWDI